MKTVSRNFFTDLLSNPINRNLILIMVSALILAVFIVTAGFMMLDQW